MSEKGTLPGDAPAVTENEITFELYGVKAALGSNRPELVEHLRALLPAGWRRCPADAVERRFALIADDAGTCSVVIDERTLSRGLELELALGMLEAQIRLYVGIKAPHMIFIHAGVVEYGGVAIVMPGKSFAGKTTLAAALVHAGATYYSDEFAVIDGRGLVHPYAKALSVRAGSDRRQTDRPVESLGWTPGSEAIPLGMIVVATYRPGAEWRPLRLSPGEGAMRLLANAVPARERPAQAMQAISRAAGEALAIESERGEAEAIAPLLLAELDRATV